MTLPGFDYHSQPKEALEIPLGERLAAMRAQRGARSREAQRRTGAGTFVRRTSPGRPSTRSRTARTAGALRPALRRRKVAGLAGLSEGHKKKPAGVSRQA